MLMECISDGLPFPEFALALPTSDRQSLSGLSDFDIRSWTVARADEYRKFAVTLLAICNSIAPVHRFPNEVLSYIFAHCWDNRNSFRLAHVCRRWRQVLLATPEFWVDAVDGECLNGDRKCGDIPPYVLAVLQRSGHLPIKPNFVQFNEALSRRLDSHLWRISTLSLDVKSADEVTWLHHTLRRGMPVLAKLVVRYEPRDCDCTGQGRTSHISSLDVEALPLNALPCLRHAELPACLLEKVAVSSLQRLRLYRIRLSDHDNPEANMRNLLRALASCQELVSLELVTALPYPDGFDTIHPDVPAIVTLPALRSFSIEDWPSRISTIMPYIQSPLVTSVHIHSVPSSPSNAFQPCGIEAWLRPSSLPDSILGAVDYVSIALDPHSDVLRFFTEEEERLHIRSHMHNDDFPRLADALQSRASVTRLKWTSSLPYGMEEDITHSMFLALQHLTTLTIHGEDSEVALRILRPRDGIAAHELVWPCLQELTIGFCWPGMPRHRDGMLTPDEAARRLSKRCAQIQSALGPRASLFGNRLAYLEFDERNDLYDDKKPFLIVSPDAMPQSIESLLQALREVVDGPVVFGGFKKKGEY